MPSLLECLQGFDLGHLMIIAELWGIEHQAPDLHSAYEQLVPALLKPAFVKEGIETLPSPARSALSDLIAAGGRIPWVAFIRLHGAVREIGPGRRDREKPYRQPISTAEVLWYRGLVARAFFDAAAGPEEFAYIPDDLLVLLPPEEPSPQQPLGRPALPDERGDILNTNDYLLDDACTLLAQPFLEDDTVADAQAPVRAAHRYLTNRPAQFHYQDALLAGLPIGSGEIESAHRYVIQSRLKLAGAWWKKNNAKSMLALRVCRANGEWDHYWESKH